MFLPGNYASYESQTCFDGELKVMKAVVNCAVVDSNYGVLRYEPELGSDGGVLGKLR